MDSGRLFYFCLMDHIVLFDDPALRGSLLPFTFTRPVAEIRVGILKISEKWEKYSSVDVSFLTQDYLQKQFSRTTLPALAINGAWLPEVDSMELLRKLKPSQALYWGKTLLATFIDESQKNMAFASEKEAIQLNSEPVLVQKTWNIFQDRKSTRLN